MAAVKYPPQPPPFLKETDTPAHKLRRDRALGLAKELCIGPPFMFHRRSSNVLLREVHNQSRFGIQNWRKHIENRSRCSNGWYLHHPAKRFQISWKGVGSKRKHFHWVHTVAWIELSLIKLESAVRRLGSTEKQLGYEVDYFIHRWRHQPAPPPS